MVAKAVDGISNQLGGKELVALELHTKIINEETDSILDWCVVSDRRAADGHLIQRGECDLDLNADCEEKLL